MVVLELNGQPMSREEYEEEKANFLLKELDVAEQKGSIVQIEEWSWHQSRVEVKFPNAAATESFRK